ncbi:hypothetical protein DNTS_009293 [Danionella cerebrum]|uniref:Uncharacterized protein n=1 Tax=Danionella cerebrum TaxID=2873325 RepID=A0A553RN73_9TELE|nr:hypothetical protein DNTS_009293 [Danionella translucida]
MPDRFKKSIAPMHSWCHLVIAQSDQWQFSGQCMSQRLICRGVRLLSGGSWLSDEVLLRDIRCQWRSWSRLRERHSGEADRLS